MTPLHRYANPLMLAASLLFLVPMTAAAAPQAAAGNNHIEFGGGYHNLSDGYDDWKGGYVSGVFHQNKDTTWNYSLHQDERFNDKGQFVSAGVTRLFNENWFGSLSVGAGSGDFHPDTRVDGTLNYRLLSGRNLVATLGAGHIEEADNVHSSNYLFIGATYYADTAPVIIEGGVTRYRSDPGDVSSSRGYVALTFGRDKQRYVTLRAETGNEAYQVQGPSTFLSDFDSTVYNVIWREWWTKSMGTNVNFESYHNDYYDRQGVTVGVFFNF